MASAVATKNWAGNQSFLCHILRPSSIDELERMICATSGPMRVFGSLHSFSLAADPGPGGTAIVLDCLSAPPELNESAGIVKVRAGTTYGALAAALAGSNWSLPNMASLPHISVVGACATATHGSGASLGNLATAVCAMSVVTGDGVRLRLERGVDAEFDAWPVHLGLLGAVYEVELALVPAFDLRQDVYDSLPWEETLADLPAVLGTASGYSVSLFTDWTDAPGACWPVFQAWRKSTPSAIAAAGGVPDSWRGGVRASTERHPLPGASAISCTPQLGVAGPAHDRLPHFRIEFTPSAGNELQSEFFVASENGAAALRALAPLRTSISPLLFVTEVRAVSADDLWLSPHHARDSVALHFTWKPLTSEVMALLPEMEAALAPFSPRPHWGKLFTMRVGAEQYARLPAFRALALRHDPDGKFRSRFFEEIGVLA